MRVVGENRLAALGERARDGPCVGDAIGDIRSEHFINLSVLTSGANMDELERPSICELDEFDNSHTMR